MESEMRSALIEEQRSIHKNCSMCSLVYTKNEHVLLAWLSDAHVDFATDSSVGLDAGRTFPYSPLPTPQPPASKATQQQAAK
jgi:hypothetical protein